MKKLKIVMLFVATLMAGCDSWIDPEVNIDPNNPLDVKMNQVLTAAEVGWAYVRGGDLSRMNSIFVQQHAGTDRQHLAFDVYNVKEIDVANSWETTYGTVLQELMIIDKKASSEETLSPHYSGIAKVLMADVLMITTDLYGDIPFSEALNEEDLTPAYDTQEEIYATIQGLLTEALQKFSATQNVFTPGAEDVIFGGNIGMWTRYARLLKAKAYLHLAKLDPANYANALTEIDNGVINSNAGDAQVVFQPAKTGNHPLKQFMDERGDIRMGAFFINLMKAEGDARLSLYAAENANDEYIGSPAGTPNTQASEPNFFAGSNSYVPLASYAEAKFIEAEAAFATGDLDRAADAHNAAVMASLTKLGVDGDNAAFETAHANFDETTITLAEIMTQKYVATYSKPEVFTDWRRTGFPAITPATGQTKIIRRLPYPQSERLYNASNLPSVGSLFDDRLWWDE